MMKFIYNNLLHISEKLVFLFGNFFGKKVKLFRKGQKNIFSILKNCSLQNKQVIWLHVSSLGEYEQALPVIEKIKENFSVYKIVLSFFSPSGYEIKKDTSPADCVIYLPIDTQKNAQKLLDILHPEIVFFVKYDFWPNYLFELQKRNIKTYLVSGLFTNNHKFFKPQNKWLKKSLLSFHHFFVQDENSKKVLINQGFKNITIAGDTRFDRVFDITKITENHDFIISFKQNNPLIIAGSCWEKGEELLLTYFHKTKHKYRLILAPHNVDDSHIKNLEKQIKLPYILHSKITSTTDLTDVKIIIIDSIGLLNKLYKYADIVYIGGGFGKSIHNIQEPAVFGAPILTGPKINKFNEAVDLQKLGGLEIIHNQEETNKIFDLLLSNESLRKEKAEITKKYALKNAGATDKIIQFLKRQV